VHDRDRGRRHVEGAAEETREGRVGLAPDRRRGETNYEGPLALAGERIPRGPGPDADAEGGALLSVADV
jgi:hypothetical protein